MLASRSWLRMIKSKVIVVWIHPQLVSIRGVIMTFLGMFGLRDINNTAFSTNHISLKAKKEVGVSK